MSTLNDIPEDPKAGAAAPVAPVETTPVKAVEAAVETSTSSEHDVAKPATVATKTAPVENTEPVVVGTAPVDSEELVTSPELGEIPAAAVPELAIIRTGDRAVIPHICRGKWCQNKCVVTQFVAQTKGKGKRPSKKAFRIRSRFGSSTYTTADGAQATGKHGRPTVSRPTLLSKDMFERLSIHGTVKYGTMANVEIAYPILITDRFVNSIVNGNRVLDAASNISFQLAIQACGPGKYAITLNDHDNSVIVTLNLGYRQSTQPGRGLVSHVDVEIDYCRDPNFRINRNRFPDAIDEAAKSLVGLLDFPDFTAVTLCADYSAAPTVNWNLDESSSLSGSVVRSSTEPAAETTAETAPETVAEPESIPLPVLTLNKGSQVVQAPPSPNA